MPCYFNGQLTGDDRTSCAATPGKIWQDEDVDFAGNPISTNFAGQSFEDIATQRQSLLDDITFSSTPAQPTPSAQYNKSLSYEGYDPGKWARENPTTASLMSVTRDVLGTFSPSNESVQQAIATIQDPQLREQAIQFAKDNPWTTAAGIYTMFGAGKTGKKLFDKVKNSSRYQGTKPVYKQVNGKPVLQTPGIKPKTTLGADAAKVGIFGYGGSQIGKEMGVISGDSGTQPPKEVKPNVFNGGTDTEPTGAEIQAIAKGKDIPDNIWDKMQTKDYWLTGMEGGSGDWDNRLYRLGEMMAYMGTPLSKRGDSPSKRWTTARTEQDKIKAAIEKERIKAQDNKNTNIFGKVPTSSAKDTIMTELKKKPWLLGFGQQYDEEQLEAFGNKGEIVYMEWIDKGATPTQALKETLDELQLGI